MKRVVFSLFVLAMFCISFVTNPVFARTITGDQKSKNVNEMLELLGFSKEEIKDLRVNKSDEADINFKNKDVRNLKIKKKDILFLAHF